MSLISTPVSGVGAPAFSEIAIPAIIVLLLAVILSAMFSYAKDARARSLRDAARIVVAPMGVVFFAAMILRTLEAVANR
jgi:cytochrome c biogenesis factor